jgi:flagellar hook-length control protein FliK
MSALHSLPSTAATASLKGQPAAVSSEPASGEVSFAAVLSAQLCLSIAPQLAALVAGSEDAASEDKATPHSATEPAVVDPSASVPVVPLTLPPVSTQLAVVAGSSQHAEPENAPETGKSVVAAKTFLPAAEFSLPARSDIQPEPVAAFAATPAPQAPASFAATLQALPDTPRHDRAVATGDVPASPNSAAVAAMPAEPRAESARHAAPLTTAVPVPVQDTRWGDSFSERVVWITGQQVQAAEIHVEPPQLGPIEVRVSITNDQANLLFTAPHAVARDAIQMSLPRLQEMLVDNGLTLGNVSVGAHTSGDQQARYRDENGANGSGGGTAAVDSTGTQSVVRLQHQLGLVDLFA